MTRSARGPRAIATAAAITVVGCYGNALACPVCYGTASARVLDAYYLSAALLTLLPFAIVGLIFGWISYRIRRHPDSGGNGAPPATIASSCASSPRRGP